ncbi:hypothetical protein LJC36_04075 [Desulfovibrio sp. OttesenSCG-928-C14]|nr:hypothetical protein [Desulfovibrio sp. OttesenSCG-928-C14]
MKAKLAVILLLSCALLFSGCAGSIPPEALTLAPESLAERQMQTRRFDTTDYETMLSAAAAVFQDLGFTLDESEYALGVLVGSKTRDATSGAQMAGAVLLAALTGAVTHVDNNQIIRASIVMRELEGPGDKEAKTVSLTDKNLQSIKRSLEKAIATELKGKAPAKDVNRIAAKAADNAFKGLAIDLRLLLKEQRGTGSSTVRITFQRVIYNTAGMVSRQEQIKDPEVYQQFFDKLSQSVFLEAHEL